MNDFEVAIGLEVHVQLRTRSKLFCACPTAYGAAPNTQVCPVCLGYPGTLPVINGEAIRLTVMTGLMIGAEINAYSKFDRKSYFYPDMPKNYQISQYDQPLCADGGVDIDLPAGRKRIRVRRIHLEEDVAKNMHFRNFSGVDFNRAGVPLMEIVSEPDLTSADEALAYLLALKQILQYAGVSDCNLEEGNIRCDVNCSVRPPGQAALGTKTELKNLNTFKGVLNALKFESARQIGVVRGGGRIVQETRRWDADAGATYAMRSKEDAHDYRYFPEPDLMPVVLAREQVDGLRAALPEAPAVRHGRFVSQYGLPDYDAGVLVADRGVAEYFEAAVRAGAAPKAASNWIMTEMLRKLSETGGDIGRAAVTPEALAELIGLVESRALNSTTAKDVFAILFEKGGRPSEIVQARGLAQVSDADAIERLVDEVVAANPGPVEDFRRGKAAALQFLVGQLMRLSRGKADPKLAGARLRARLAAQQAGG